MGIFVDLFPYYKDDFKVFNIEDNINLNNTGMKILIDNGHGINTPGKCSPDGKFREYKYTREIAIEVVKRLKAEGYDAERIVTEEADISLGQRCARVNAWCDRMGNKNVVLVSIHNNAAGNNGQWMAARGWEAWTSKGQTQGDKLADCLYSAAKKYLSGMKIRTDMADGDMDKESNFTILYRSKCPACLTENLFQDNKEDVVYLVSAEGRKAIVDLHVDGIKEYVGRYGKK